jgi:multimeric flavodoxin WrbA
MRVKFVLQKRLVMQQVIISIVYHSGQGHTKQIAEILAENLQSELSRVHLISVDEVKEQFDLLHQSDTIVFGSPTYFGNVSAGFKQFMELTGGFWYNQVWKDKLATAFTVSSSRSGDKLNTLISLALFAAQHSMQWISQGIMPRYCNNEQTDGQNRIGSYLGLMIQSDNAREINPPHPGDILTTELFAKRILEVTLKFKNIKIYNYEPSTN